MVLWLYYGFLDSLLLSPCIKIIRSMNHLLLNCKKSEAGALIILCQEVISERKTTRTVQWHLLTSTLNSQLPTWGRGNLSQVSFGSCLGRTHMLERRHIASLKWEVKAKSELVHKIFSFCDYYVLDFVLTLENKHSWYISYEILRPLYRFKCINIWETTWKITT